MTKGDMNWRRRHGLCTAAKTGTHKSPAQAAICPVHKAQGIKQMMAMSPADIAGMLQPERVSAAKIEGLPESVLRMIANSNDPGVIRNIAENPSTPKSMLMEFLKNDTAAWASARRPDLDDDMVEVMLRTYRGRKALAEGAKTPVGVLVDLVRTGSAEEQRAAFLNQRMPGRKAGELYWEAMRHEIDLDHDDATEFALSRRTVSPEVIADVFERHPNTAMSVAAHRSATPAILEDLATSEDHNVRFHVAKNQNTPALALARLMTDPDGNVRRAALRRVDETICGLFGISKDNHQAIEVIREFDWLTLDPEGPEVALAKGMYPNA